MLATMLKRVFTHSKITTLLLTHLGFWSVLLITLFSSVVFVKTYQNVKTQTLNALLAEATHARQQHQSYFAQIEMLARTLNNAFLQRYHRLQEQNAVIDQFDEWYPLTSPGVFRLHPEFFSGKSIGSYRFEHVTAFAGLGISSVSDELKRRMLAAQYVLNEFGPAWEDIVTNTHISMPENVLIMYSRDDPWGLQARADLIITDFSVVAATLKANNPARTGIWSRLYYDYSAKLWTITYQQPLDLFNQHLINASFDISLDDMIDGILRSAIPQSEHFLFDRHGNLLAANNMQNFRDDTLATYKAHIPWFPELQKAIASVHYDNAAETLIYDDVINDQLVVLSKLPALGWMVALYPQNIVQQQALALPIKLAVGSFLLVCVLLATLYVLLLRFVSRPLNSLTYTASLLNRENYQDLLTGSLSDPAVRCDEIDNLQKTYLTVANKLMDAQQKLEHEVNVRTLELATANAQLAELAYLDGLTGIFNRRKFDEDLQFCLAHDNSESPAVLALCDLDFFKHFNDNYGHHAGDAALRCICSYLKQHFSGHVYRFGGEELALLILPGTPWDSAEFERLRQGIEGLAIPHGYQDNGHTVLTISVGITELKAGDTSMQAIMRADRQLYDAKRKGRNHVQFTRP